MTRNEVVDARREWKEAEARVSDLEEAVQRAERRLETAHHSWDQWQDHEDVLTAMQELENARDAEREARREFCRRRDEYEANTL